MPSEESKLKLADLEKIVAQELEFQRAYKYRINVCCSSGCVPFGALKVLKAFEDAVIEFGVEKECKVARTGCIGTCWLVRLYLLNLATTSTKASHPTKLGR